MTTGIRSSADGSKSYIQVGGTDRITIDAATGVTTLTNALVVPSGGTVLKAYGRSSDNLSQLAFYDNTGVTLYGLIQAVPTGGGGLQLVPVGATGNVTVNAVAGLGYGPGAGGTVTQATSKSTSVTLNKPCGQITMNAASLAAGAVVGFVLNNSLLQGSDTIVPSIVANGVVDPAPYNVWSAVSSGGANTTIYLRNVSAGALSQAVIIDFKIIKGATA